MGFGKGILALKSTVVVKKFYRGGVKILPRWCDDGTAVVWEGHAGADRDGKVTDDSKWCDSPVTRAREEGDIV